jgi:hypothetical protein
MPRYEVEIQITATAWVDMEADDEAEAIDAAKESVRLSDCQWWEVTDTSAMKYQARSA